MRVGHPPRSVTGLLVAALGGMTSSVAAGCLPQSEQCAEYVACQNAYDSTVDTSAFEAGGACWGSPQQAAVCNDQCGEALAALRQLPDLPDECASAQ